MLQFSDFNRTEIWAAIVGFATDFWVFITDGVQHVLSWKNRELNNIDFLIAEMAGLLLITAAFSCLCTTVLLGLRARRRRLRETTAIKIQLKKTQALLTQSRADVQRAERKREELSSRLADLQSATLRT